MNKPDIIYEDWFPTIERRGRRGTLVPYIGSLHWFPTTQ